MAISRNNANLFDIMDLVKTNVSSNLNCHNIGRIIEFDASNQTCTVQIMQVKEFNGNYYDPAPITDVPLIIYGGGTGHITLPNPVGTYCLLFFMDRNIDTFLDTGEQYVPETTRMHDFTDCIAITTFKTLVNPIADYDELAVSILNSGEVDDNTTGDSYIKVYPNGINIHTTETDVQTGTTQTSDIEMNDKIHLEADKGAIINLSDKILLKNSTQNFMTLLDTLITDFIKPLYPADPKKRELETLLANFKLLFEEVTQENT